MTKRGFSKKNLIEASKKIEGIIYMGKEDMKMIKPLIDKEDIKKILAMNQTIVDVNCDLLKIISTPIWLADKLVEK